MQEKRNDHAKEKGKKRKGSQSESAIEEEGDCKQQLFSPFLLPPPPPPIPRYSWAVVTEPPTHPPILTDWVGGGTRMGTKMHFSNPHTAPFLYCSTPSSWIGQNPLFPTCTKGNNKNVILSALIHRLALGARDSKIDVGGGGISGHCEERGKERKERK